MKRPDNWLIDIECWCYSPNQIPPLRKFCWLEHMDVSGDFHNCWQCGHRDWNSWLLWYLQGEQLYDTIVCSFRHYHILG